MATGSYLLHPDLLASVPLGNSLTTRLLHQRILETLANNPKHDPHISIVVRAFNEAGQLAQLFEDVEKQIYYNEVEVVVVDNGSSDDSAQIAKYHGAEVVTLPQSSHTYPKSLNLGMDATSHELVFLTVAHARLSNVYQLHAGARHFCENHDTAGVFGTTLPNKGASYVERWTAPANFNLVLAKPAQQIKKCGLGVLAGTGAMIAKSVWRELGRFDERYEAGGEDAALARLILKKGYGIVQEPALSVHHSHGLGVRDCVRQWVYWQQILAGPKPYDRQKLLARRPDLRANYSALDAKGQK
jgi:glycosyltransferase involved in cell wall biosynthesis